MSPVVSPPTGHTPRKIIGFPSALKSLHLTIYYQPLPPLPKGLQDLELFEVSCSHFPSSLTRLVIYQSQPAHLTSLPPQLTVLHLTNVTCDLSLLPKTLRVLTLSGNEESPVELTDYPDLEEMAVDNRDLRLENAPRLKYVAIRNGRYRFPFRGEMKVSTRKTDFTCFYF